MGTYLFIGERHGVDEIVRVQLANEGVAREGSEKEENDIIGT